MIQLSKEDELFHKRTGQWGGIYLSDNPLIERKLDDYKKEALDMLRRIGFDGVELKFINSPKFNALATIIDNKDYIGLNLGSIFILEDLFFRMLSHPEVFPNIGNSAKEIPKKLYNPRIIDAEQLLNAKGTDEKIMPSDEKMAYFAFSLAKAAFIFIILHEVGHLFWGHLSLISNYSEVNLISEDNTPNYKELTELDYQTLEIDADSNAINQMIMYMLSVGENMHLIGENFKPFFKTRQEIIFNMSFSVMCVFTLFDSNDYNPHEFKSLRHPPVGIRQKNFVLLTGQILEMLFGEKIREEYLPIIGDACGEAMKAFNLISETEVRYQNFFKSFDEQFDKDHLDEILNNWKNIRPKLLSNSRRKLAE